MDRRIYRFIFVVSQFIFLAGLSSAQPVTPPVAIPGNAAISLIRTWTPKKPISNEADASSSFRGVTEVAWFSEYMNGLGKPIQSVRWATSPLGNDQVLARTYDPGTGRESYKYLPFTSSSVSGNIKLDAFQQQATFCQTQYPGETFYYSRTDHEASPLGRVLNTYAAGDSWVGASRGAGIQYLSNTASEGVKVWTMPAAAGSLPLTSSTYGDGLLYETLSNDENGKKVIEYKNKEGQLILRKKQLADVPGIDHTGWLCTYYVYDDLHHLRFVLPPRAVELYLGGAAVSSFADDLCFRYEFDDHGRQIIKKAPGAGEIWMIYDALNRLVMTQDANQRLLKNWLVVLYDNQGRQIETGKITYDGSRDQLQQIVTSQTTMASFPTCSNTPANLTLPTGPLSGDYQATQSISSNTNFSSQDGAVFIAEIINCQGYTNSGISPNPLPPGATIDPLSFIFYDDYGWIAGTGTSLGASMDVTNTGNGQYFITSYNTSPYYAQPITQSYTTRGKVTGTMTRLLDGSSQYRYTVNFYDDHGRVLQAQSINVSGGRDITTSQYDFSGKVLRTLTQHQKSGTSPQSYQLLSKMSYDNSGRLLKITRTISGTVNGQSVSTPEQTIGAYQYDEAGNIKNKSLGNNIENLAFEYNIHGSLLGINRNYLNPSTSSSSANYFALELGYDKQASIASTTGYAGQQYNGNISGTIWKSRGDGVARKYDYTYDNVSQLTGATFLQNTSGASWDANTLDFSVSGMSYDANGNLESMTQKGWKQGMTAPIDQLTYHYLSNTSNQLLNIVDGSNDPNSTLGDFHYPGTGTKSDQAVDYQYDPNGNVIQDNNKSSSISYNYLNLPAQVTITSKGNIAYVYDATGFKLKKIVTDNSVANKSVVTTTTYMGDFVYSSRTTTPTDPNYPDYTDVLQYITHEEGRSRFNPATGTTPANFVNDFYIKDQLGNIRMVLTDEQQTDIYPAATFEGTGQSTDPIAVEQSYYNINPSQVVANPSGITAYQNNNGNPPVNNNPNCNDVSSIKQTDLSQKVYQMNAAVNEKVGLGITLKVMSGDKLNIFGKSFYSQINAGGQSANLAMAATDIISGLLGAPSSPAFGHTTAGQIAQNTNGTITPLNSFINSHDNPGAESTPRAYINYVFFDEQFNYVSSGTSQVGGPNSVKSHHDADASLQNVQVPKNGYVYVFCSNESPVNVSFDNLQVTLTHGPILEETHYYPAGLAIAAISSRALGKMPNWLKYQGKELQEQEFADGSGLEEYDFEARYYDPQIGRWHNPDPVDQFASPYLAMGNNWPNGTDPSGKITLIGDLIAGAVGAVVNLGTELITGQVHSVWQAFGYLGSGFVGGVVYVNAGPVAAGAVTSFGNALVGGGTLEDALEQAVVGAATSFVAGPLSEAIGPALSPVTAGLGPVLSRVTTQVATSAVVGGIIGGGMSYLMGGDFSKGFVQGSLTGLAAGAVGAGVNEVLSGMTISEPNPFDGEPDGPMPSLSKADPNGVPLAPITEGTPDPSANAGNPARNPVWEMGPSPRGFAIEEITIDQYYKGWMHVPRAPTIDGIRPDGVAVVSIKSTYVTRLNVTQNMERLAQMPAEVKILHIVTPPGHNITNLPQIITSGLKLGIMVVQTTH